MRDRLGGGWVAWVAIAGLSLTACAVNKRPPTTLAAIAESRGPLAAAHRAAVDSAVERLVRRVATRGDATLDLLLLSGGGQAGAYGAGFLRGWRTRPDAPMPKFDLVTGISTGALQAPFALLGTESSLDTLTALYLRAADAFAPKIDWFFWLRKTGGVVKTDRFRATIASMFDARMATTLRSEFRDDRQMLVGTTDFDLAMGRIWDISRELDTTDVALRRTHEILVASSAIPGIFPPKTIDGHVQSDGGTTMNVLPVLDLDGYRLLAERLKARGVTTPVTVRLWVVFNIWPYMAPTVVEPANRKAITTRSQLVMFFAQGQLAVQYLSMLARAVSAEVPGLRVEFRYTAVPAELAGDPAASKLFDRPFMQRLETLGYDRARGASPWDSVGSLYSRPPVTSP